MVVERVERRGHDHGAPARRHRATSAARRRAGCRRTPCRRPRRAVERAPGAASTSVVARRRAGGRARRGRRVAADLAGGGDRRTAASSRCRDGRRPRGSPRGPCCRFPRPPRVSVEPSPGGAEIERVLVLHAGDRRVEPTTRPSVDLACCRISVKIVPVASGGLPGCTHILTSESRLLDRLSGLGLWPHRTWRPDLPDEPVGRHQHQLRDPGLVLRLELARHARPRGSELGGGEAAGRGRLKPEDARNTHAVQIEKDERDLWRDRRSASGSRPMTTR